jgi:hypothetical protein
VGVEIAVGVRTAAAVRHEVRHRNRSGIGRELLPALDQNAHRSGQFAGIRLGYSTHRPGELATDLATVIQNEELSRFRAENSYTYRYLTDDCVMLSAVRTSGCEAYFKGDACRFMVLRGACG